MTRLRVALRVPVGRPLPDIAAFVARCEDAGFDGVGIHDHPSSGRDAYLALALAAQATHRLRLFPATSSPVVRHPLVLASLAHSLEEIAPGRICLTVAPGFISTRSIGQPRARGGCHARRDPRPATAACRGRGRVRSDIDPSPEPKCCADAGLFACGRATHDRTRGRGGRWRVSHGRPAPGCHPRRVAPPGGRAPRGPAAPWPVSRWCSWSRSVSDPMPRWERDGYGVGSRRDSRSSPIRASRIFAG